jgi:hypothetical protein
MRSRVSWFENFLRCGFLCYLLRLLLSFDPVTLASLSAKPANKRLHLLRVKADAASLCITCVRDIHAANPFAERVPVTPLFESNTSHSVKSFQNDNNNYDAVKDEAEAASWLIFDPKSDLNSSPYLFSDSEAIPFRFAPILFCVRISSRSIGRGELVKEP